MRRGLDRIRGGRDKLVRMEVPLGNLNGDLRSEVVSRPGNC